MVPQPQASPLIAGSVLPIKRAEELLQTLPGVIAVRIIASDTGAVDEIHVLTSSDVTPKSTVRNIESALIAHLGMRVDHRKISVATSLESRKPKPEIREEPREREREKEVEVARAPVVDDADAKIRRMFCFEDVEVRRSRVKGIACKVTLSKGEKSFSGEAEGMENERSRMELAARAALRAIAEGEPSAKPLDIAGAKVIEAFEREFVFVGVTVQQARESVLLTGSCEVKDSPETASVLAVLDATNRWLLQPRDLAR
ncbi:MAG: hypothetical protein U0163_09545 [Gemmatimonadaceae bacterium]